MLKEFSNVIPPKYEGVWFLTKTPAALFRKFAGFFTLVEASGGVVSNKSGDILFIYRNGKWDLPKGKKETGESSRQAAIREVEEECGITGVKISSFILTTWHTYKLKDRPFMLKKTRWYKMLYAGMEKPSPQKEEGITKIIWADKEKIQTLLRNTYGSIRQLIDAI